MTDIIANDAAAAQLVAFEGRLWVDGGGGAGGRGVRGCVSDTPGNKNKGTAPAVYMTAKRPKAKRRTSPIDGQRAPY